MLLSLWAKGEFSRRVEGRVESFLVLKMVRKWMVGDLAVGFLEEFLKSMGFLLECISSYNRIYDKVM
jgi:hypothetical protein